jgi:hypothetical protein
MLIRFVTKNFLSFKDEIEFSMIPGRTRKHPHHIIHDKAWNGINILRAGVIYGANASGKSNLIKAMYFAKNLIVHGTKARHRIPIECYKLDLSCRKLPSKFEFEFKINGRYYAYGFELDSQKIQKEWLYRINKKSQTMIFEREASETQNISIEFGDIDFKDKKEELFLEFVAKGTRQNQLFLTESSERNVEYFDDVFTWFSKTLRFVFPDTQFLGLETSFSKGDALSNSISKYLQLFNTGISGLSLELVDDIDTEFSELPEGLREDLFADVAPDNNVIINVSGNQRNQRYEVLLNENQEIQVFKLMTKHKMIDSTEEALFEIKDESDGTQRLMDLIPGLFEILNNDRVFIIDELNRSLHPTLSYEIIQHFLRDGEGRESQLIVTTHEANLLNLDLLRRDEIWFTEKNTDEVSSVYSLEEFAPRYDKDIRKGYLLGRFGAIPIVGGVSSLGWVKK